MKAKITIAGTLKPVSEPRSYEKIATTLASNNYEVDIIGAFPDTKVTPKNVRLHAHKYLRNGLSRLTLPWKILHKIIKIKPDILIVNTHELLIVGTLYRLFYQKKIIYDIRENYNYNLRYQNIYPSLNGWLLGGYVRFKEILTSPFIDYFFLAEQCYAEEIEFVKSRRHIVLENKSILKEQSIRNSLSDRFEFLLAGTISKLYGALDALDFLNYFPVNKFSLQIIGHCPDQRLIELLETRARETENLTVSVSLEPIPHTKIMEAITNRTIGILPYRTNKSTINKMPTKLYDYIGLRIPVLISPNKKWASILEEYNAGLIQDFSQPPNIEHISNSVSLIKNSKPIDLQNIMWFSEEEALLRVLNQILSN